MHYFYCGIYLTLILIIVVCIVKNRWETIITGGPPELIYFFKPDCPFCAAFDPEWEKLEKMEAGCAKLSKIDITADPDFARRRGFYVEMVPSIVLFPFGHYRSYEEYKGQRSAESINKWLFSRLNGMGICNSLIPEYPY